MHPPNWWQKENGSLLPKYLAPLGHLYGQIVSSRFRYTKPYKCKHPILCVGNFTLGGTGKTPISIKLMELLTKEGWTPSFLSRGYGGSQKGPLLVDQNDHSASEVGDEPLLLAEHGPTVIAKTRREGAWLLEQRKTDLIIMDDGFQNPTLAKTLSILSLDSAVGLGNERIFPAGPLRAPLNFQLAAADAIIITGSSKNQLKETLKTKHNFNKPIFSGEVKPNTDIDWVREKPILAYAGIARPEKLFKSLEQVGGQVIRRTPFPDHYQFKAKDAEQLIKLAIKDDLQLITTEKDMVRINAANHHQLRALKRMSQAFPVSFEFHHEDEKNLLQLLKKQLQQAQE